MSGTDKKKKPLSMIVTVQNPRALNIGLESAKIHNLPCLRKPKPDKEDDK